MTTIKHYTASWCSPCRALKPIIQEITDQNPSVDYHVVDVDLNKHEADSMGIRSIPVVVILKNGVEVSRIVGLQSKSIYEQAIAKAKGEGV